MSSRYSHSGAAVGPTLAGLSLVAAIAHEASDAIPVVKQVLGVVARILELAEKIDKDREALHALAEKSGQLGQRLKDFLGNEEPHAKLLPSLERMHRAVHDVEVFMEKHVARNCLSRAFCYAFTVNHHFTRLSRSLEDAWQEFITVTLLVIEQDTQYDGEFRLIRHCEVDKLEMFRENRNEEGSSNLVVRYHRARVDGQLLVVRCCEAGGLQNTHDRSTPEETLYSRMASCDGILKEMSTVQRSHPNVARIYGWSKGSVYDRFMVFKSGFRNMDSVLRDSVNPIISIIRWSFRLLDAVHHLKLMAISWAPCGPAITLDENLEPTIGLQNDLCRMDPETEPVNKIEFQVYWTFEPIRLSIQKEYIASAEVQAALARYHDERISNLLAQFETIGGHRHVIPKSEFSLAQMLSDGIADGLVRMLAEEAGDTSWQVDSWMWANILLALDKARGYQLKTGIKVPSGAWSAGSESFEVFAVDEDSENIVYDRYRPHVRDDGWERIRETPGIVPPFEGDSENRGPYLIESGPSTNRASG